MEVETRERVRRMHSNSESAAWQMEKRCGQTPCSFPNSHRNLVFLPLLAKVGPAMPPAPSTISAAPTSIRDFRCAPPEAKRELELSR